MIDLKKPFEITFFSKIKKHPELFFFSGVREVVDLDITLGREPSHLGRFLQFISEHLLSEADAVMNK